MRGRATRRGRDAIRRRVSALHLAGHAIRSVPPVALGHLFVHPNY